MLRTCAPLEMSCMIKSTSGLTKCLGEMQQDVIHHMGRRCRDWNYGGRAIYMITVNLKERGRSVLAEWPRFLGVSAKAQYHPAQNLPVSGQAQELEIDNASAVVCASAETPKVISMPLTPLGEKVLACWRRIPEFWPMVELLECQVMPDHFHGLLFVKEVLRSAGKDKSYPRPETGRSRTCPETGRSCARPETGKVLGDVIRGFKTGCREVGWQEGYVDNILFREGQLKRMAEYIRDNPRRLAEKRANPALFRRVVDLAIDLPVSGQAQNGGVAGRYCASAESPKFKAHFQAIGNTGLLQMPVMLPVQCSRRDFAYRRERLATGGWKILHNAAGEPLVESTSTAFEKKCEDALICASKGAVLVSPCISHGEREIARRAHAAGVRVIALRNKGFAPFEKPNGALFDQCAKGNLLLLAPAAWPYIPGEKPPTRESSLVLNRIAQLLAGNGEAEINYNGTVFSDIDAKVFEALQSPQNGGVK